MIVERWYDFAKTSISASERSDAGEKLGQELRSEKRQNDFEYYAHLFKKVTAVTGVTGKKVYIQIAVTVVTSITQEKYKNRYMITAPTFLKSAFMNIAPTFAEAVIKTNTAPTWTGAEKGVGVYDPTWQRKARAAFREERSPKE